MSSERPTPDDSAVTVERISASIASMLPTRSVERRPLSRAACAVFSIWPIAALACCVAAACCCPPRLICSIAIMIWFAAPEISWTAVGQLLRRRGELHRRCRRARLADPISAAIRARLSVAL